MPVTHIGPVDLQNPFVHLAVGLAVLAFLVIDHLSVPFDWVGSFTDAKMHHEVLIVLTLLYVAISLYKCMLWLTVVSR